MRSWKSWNIVFAVALFGAAGCGGDDPSYDATGKVTELADAVCERAFACCDAGENAYFLGPYVTAENCSERLVSAEELSSSSWAGIGVNGLELGVELPNLAVLDRAAAEGRVRFDDTALAACLEYLRAVECNAEEPAAEPVEGCDPTPAEPEIYPCDPDDLIVGLVGEGGPCDEVLENYECADDLVCVTQGGWGGPIVVFAKEAGANGTCERPKAVNEPCFEDQECEEGLYCSQLDGTCQVPRALGEDCQYAPIADSMAYPDYRLLLVECDDGLTCSPLTNTCVGLCVQGTECWNDSYCDDKAGLVCVKEPGEWGFCDQPRGAGGFCFEQDDCADGFGCDLAAAPPAGECVALTANGVGPCASHSECASGFCSPFTLECEAKLAVGADCPTADSAQCVDTARCADLTDDAVDNPTCVALLADGVGPCSFDYECVEDAACVAATCRTLPLADGAECELDFQCESDFCNSAAATPVCVTERSLANGADCDEDDVCASLVCFEATCAAGASIGTECGGLLLPCDPFTAFCDTDLDTPVCAAFTESGASCTRDLECRSGDCALTDWNRWMCEPAAAPDALVCDGL